MNISFVFNLRPVPKQSFRHYSRNGKHFGYRPKNLNDYQEAIKLQATRQLPEGFRLISSNISVIEACFIFKTTDKKKWNTLKGTSPDLDNLCKGLLDGLEGIVYKNDSQVTRFFNISKSWGMDNVVKVTIGTD